VLEGHQAQVGEERSTRAPLTEGEVRALLAAVDEVVIVRGRAAELRPAREVVPGDLLGPTGRFRAPIVRRGRRLLVGFHAGALESLL
jgi:hypothetical protein